MTAAVAGHRYAVAAVDAIGVALVILSLRRVALHRDRAGTAAHHPGPALVRRPSRPAASWPP